LNVVIDGDGEVSDAKAVSGPPELTQAAIDCVKPWEYAPPIHSPATATVKFEFQWKALTRVDFPSAHALGYPVPRLTALMHDVSLGAETPTP